MDSKNQEKIPKWRVISYLAIFTLLLTNLLIVVMYKDYQPERGKAAVNVFFDDFLTNDHLDSENTTAKIENESIVPGSPEWIRIAGGDKNTFLGEGGSNFSVTADDNFAWVFYEDYNINPSVNGYIKTNNKEIIDSGNFVGRGNHIDSERDGSGNIWFVHNPDLGREIVVKKNDGTSWQSESVFYSGLASAENNPNIEIDNDGNPWLAWLSSGKIKIGKNVNDQWLKIDGTPGFDEINCQTVFSTLNYRYEINLKFNESNFPMVALVNQISSSKNEVYFVKWSGSAWTNGDGQTLGCELIDSDGDSPGMAVDMSGQPWIVWRHYVSTTTWGVSSSTINVKKLDNLSWVAADNSLSEGAINEPKNNSDSPRIIVNKNNDVFVTWFEYNPSTDGSKIAAAKLIDGYWQPIDGQSPSFTILPNEPDLDNWSHLATLNKNSELALVAMKNSYPSDVIFTQWNGDGFSGMGGLTGWDVFPNEYTGKMSFDISTGGNMYLAHSFYNNSAYMHELSFYYGAFEKNSVYSTNINNTSAENVVSAVLDVSENTNGGSISYYLSNNGGNTWEMATPGTEVIFSGEGADLRWKAELVIPESGQLPSIDSVAVNYSVIDITHPLSISMEPSAGSDSFKINLDVSFADIDGAQGTTTGTVSGLASYQLSNDGLTWSDDIVLESYHNGEVKTYTDWDLTLYGGNNGAGNKIIYVRAKDKDGNIANLESQLIQTYQEEFATGALSGHLNSDNNSISLLTPGVNRLTQDIDVSMIDTSMMWNMQTNVAYLDSGNYVVAFTNDRSETDYVAEDGLYFQLFSSVGAKIGNIIKTDIPADYWGSAVGIAVMNNSFVLANHQYFQVFDNSGSVLTTQMSFLFSTDTWDWVSIGRVDGNKFGIVRPSATNLYFDVYDEVGNNINSSLIFSGATTITVSNFVKINNNEYLAIWTNASNNIYAQKIGADYLPVGASYRVDQALSPKIGAEYYFGSTINSAGDVMIAWYDARVTQNNNMPTQIYGRILNADGSFKTDEFIVAQDLIEPSFIGQSGSSLNTYSPPSIVGLDNNFLVSWIEKDGVSKTDLKVHIKGQLVDNNGSLSGDVFKMETNEKITETQRRSFEQAMASNGSSSIVLTWFDGRDSTDYSAGTRIMTNFWSYIEDASGSYTSPIFDLFRPTTISKLAWTAATTTGQSVKMSIRAGNSPDLSDGLWTDGVGTELLFELPLAFTNSRYVQYRADMEAVSTPSYLYDVALTYDGIARTSWTVPAAPVDTRGNSNSIPPGLLKDISDNYREQMARGVGTTTPTEAIPDKTREGLPAVAPTTSPKIVEVVKPVTATATIPKVVATTTENEKVIVKPVIATSTEVKKELATTTETDQTKDEEVAKELEAASSTTDQGGADSGATTSETLAAGTDNSSTTIKTDELIASASVSENSAVMTLVKKGIKNITKTKTYQAAKREVDTLRQDEVVVSATKKVATPIVQTIAVGVSTIGAIAFATSAVGSQVALIVNQFGSQFSQFTNLQALLSAFGIRRRRRWGVVKDFTTKEPLANVAIQLMQKPFDKMIETQMTDKHGRFSFVVNQEAGLVKGSANISEEYYFKTLKEGYEIYTKIDSNPSIYHGQTFKAELLNQENLNFEIYLAKTASQAVTLPDNKVALFKALKFFEYLSTVLSPYFLIFGTLLSAVIALIIPEKVNIAIFSFYLILDLAQYLAAKLTIKSVGYIKGRDKQPVPLAIVRLFHQESNQLLNTKVTSDSGKFNFLLLKGNYYITVVAGGYQEFTSKAITAKDDDLVNLEVVLG